MHCVLEKRINGNEAGRVSVVVCTYRHACDILLQSIDSVLNQDYPDIEVIIADDGTDGFDTKKYAGYIEQHASDNVKNYAVITNERNLGTVANINKALSLTTGEYVRIIAGDDAYADSGVFSCQIAVLKRDKDLFGVVGPVQQCDWELNPIEDRRIVSSNKYLSEMFGKSPSEIKKEIFKRNLFPVSVQATCFRRVFFESIGLVEEKYSVVDDLPLIQNIIDNVEYFRYEGSVSVLHRSGKGISTTDEYFCTRRSAYYRDMYVFARSVWCKDTKEYGRVKPWILAETYRKSYELIRSGNRKGIRSLADKALIVLMRVAIRPGETITKVLSAIKSKG